MFNKIRMTWISWVQIGAIVCSLPITLTLTLQGFSEAMTSYRFGKALEMFGAGNPSQAIEHIDSTIDGNEEFMPAREMKARILLDDGESGQALLLYKEIQTFEPNNPRAQLGLAACKIVESEPRFLEWKKLADAGDPGAEAARTEVDRAIGEARDLIEKAVDMARTQGAGSYADGHIYLGMLHLMSNPATNENYVGQARDEFMKAFPEAQSRGYEIPSRAGMMRLFNGLGVASYLESLALWADVDRVAGRNLLQTQAFYLRPPGPSNEAVGGISADALLKSNLAARKSHEAAHYLLSACHYGELWRDPYQNFEMAMTFYLVREELAQTQSPDNISDFIDLALVYEAHKKRVFDFYERLYDRDSVAARFDIRPETAHLFGGRATLTFTMALSIAGTIQGNGTLASRALGDSEGLLTKDTPIETRIRYLLSATYIRANELLIRTDLDPRSRTTFLNNIQNAVISALEQYSVEQGMTIERRAWLSACVALAYYLVAERYKIIPHYVHSLEWSTKAVEEAKKDPSADLQWIAQFRNQTCQNIKVLIPQNSDDDHAEIARKMCR